MRWALTIIYLTHTLPAAAVGLVRADFKGCLSPCLLNKNTTTISIARSALYQTYNSMHVHYVGSKIVIIKNSFTMSLLQNSIIYNAQLTFLRTLHNVPQHHTHTHTHTHSLRSLLHVYPCSNSTHVVVLDCDEVDLPGLEAVEELRLD